MLTEEQSEAAANALAKQRAPAPPPGTPRNPFVLPTLMVFLGAVIGLVAYLTGSRSAYLIGGVAIFLVVMLIRQRSGK